MKVRFFSERKLDGIVAAVKREDVAGLSVFGGTDVTVVIVFFGFEGEFVDKCIRQFVDHFKIDGLFLFVQNRQLELHTYKIAVGTVGAMYLCRIAFSVSLLCIENSRSYSN